MAGRPSQASRRRGASPKRTSTPRSRQNGRQTGRARPAVQRRQPSQPGVAIRAARGLWMGLAHGVGWTVRAVGRQAATARDLDPEHRRDGAGLLLLGLGILTAVAIWFSGAGPVGARIADTIRLFFGAVAVVLPVLLLIGAYRLMRVQEEPEQHRGRGLVGWSALIVSTDALLHIGQNPVDNVQRDYAGGLIGAGFGGALEQAITPWVAVPLLALSQVGVEYISTRSIGYNHIDMA
ncbi:DNA translocase FtsK 4TM domain-containing protein, partial [Micromonospora zhanjiangensis]